MLGEFFSDRTSVTPSLLQISIRGIPHMGYKRLCGSNSPKGMGIVAVLVITRVLILAISALDRVQFLHSCLELGMFFEEVSFSLFSVGQSTKSLSQMFTPSVSGHKKGTERPRF